MYLKSVEIQGFKSFADKVKLEFGPGITAVVGPNGSGKSNISDCIRWVLGEQSAKTLRGSKMEDVIFAGSPLRRPLSMAEVSLTLDNSSGILNIPYQEVTVSRRVFRSGEAEYLINKNPCRLKDVQDLFNDTGLGKESFALIGQGKVEEILNSKPEERRALIEEAAGIVRYRNRKKETLKKLEETDQNLNRVRDIIAELCRNLEPLKTEAERALQYKTFKTELDRLELGVAKKRLSSLYDKLALANKEIQLNTERLEVLETSSSKLDSQVEKKKLQLNILDEELANLQKNIADLTDQANKLEHLLAVAEERQRYNNEQQERVRGEIKKGEEQRTQLQEKYNRQLTIHQELQNQIEQEKKAVDDAEQQIESLKSSRLELSNLVDKLKNVIFDSLQSLARLRNKYNQISFEKENYTQEVSKNTQRISRLRDEITEKSEILNSLFSSIKEKKQYLVDTSDLKKALRHEKVMLEEDLKDLEEKLSLQNEGLHKLKSRHQALVDLQRDHEGYFQGVRAVLGAKTRQHPLCSRIVGVVGELINVSAEYEQAIEVALGNSIQNLVAEDDKAAEDAINYLKQTGSGRATFLPLNTIKVRELSKEFKELLEEQGVLGIAADLVDVDPKYHKVILHLLGNILVTDNLKTARAISRKSGYNLRIVTLDGDIINPGGSLTGGSLSKKSSAILSRSRQIKELNELIAVKKAELEKAEQNVLDKKKSLQEIVFKLEKLENKIQNTNLELVTLEQTYKNTRQEIAKLEQEIELLQAENAQLAEQLADLLSSEKEISKQIVDLENENQALEKEYSDKQQLLKSEEEKNQVQYDSLTALRVKLAGLLEKEKAYQAELSDYYEKERELNLNSKKLQEELAKLDKQKQDLQEEISQNRAKLQKSLNEIAVSKNALSAKEVEREKLKGLVTELESKQRVVARELGGVKEALQEQKVVLARLETEKKNEENRLEERFQIRYEDIQEAADDSPETLARIANLRRQMAKLGEVNMAAIEEYKRQKERHDFLTQQERDLVEAKEVLNKVILEVDQVMTKRFAKTFAEVNEAFGEIYQKLFGGGFAKLQLTDPEDLLETGVDIVVQPPGKKLQNLTLLSGGERALTVIALLFALLSCKPSPFCVLDEIEASLDEANVERFAQLLKLFAQKTQFIVISHRQGTIEVADALYGVTMEESGVSKIVSVRLTDEKFKSA